MKKILSVVMVICILFALCSVSASAKIAPDCLNGSTLSAMDDNKIVYGAIEYVPCENLATYEFSYWVEVNYLCDTADWDLVRDGEMFLAEYKKYIESQHEAVLSAGEAFFEKYFDSSADELVLNSDQRPMIAVKTTAKKLKVLKDAGDCSIFAIGSFEQVEYNFEVRDRSELVPSDDAVNNLSSEELIYALHFYKNYESIRYWDEDYTDYFYCPLYSHYPMVTDDEATADEPDYLLVSAGSNMIRGATCADGFGDKYMVETGSLYSPYGLGYYVIALSDAPVYKVYTLREAWNMNLAGIEDVFTDYGLGEIRGDSDGDKKITVKDATFVQKCLAGIDNFDDREQLAGINENDSGSFCDRVSDMNMDGEVDVKDATAIQKYVAGLEYK